MRWYERVLRKDENDLPITIDFEAIAGDLSGMEKPG